MEVGNKVEDQVIVIDSEKLPETKVQESSITHRHLLISIEELGATLEDTKTEKSSTDDVKKNEPEENEPSELCRFCLHEEPLYNLEAPCGCIGSVKVVIFVFVIIYY